MFFSNFFSQKFYTYFNADFFHPGKQNCNFEYDKYVKRARTSLFNKRLSEKKINQEKRL